MLFKKLYRIIVQKHNHSIYIGFIQIINFNIANKNMAIVQTYNIEQFKNR